MRPDIIDLQAFYGSRQGQLVRRLVGRQIRLLVAGAARRPRPRARLCGAVPGPAGRGVGAGLRDHAAGAGRRGLAAAAAEPGRPRDGGRAAAARSQHRPRADGARAGIGRADPAPAARGLAGAGGRRPGDDRGAEPARPLVPERDDARSATASRSACRSSRRRCAACCSRRGRSATALYVPPSRSPLAAAHGGRLGAGRRPALGAAVRRRARDDRGQADLRPALRARQETPAQAGLCAGAADGRGGRAGRRPPGVRAAAATADGARTAPARSTGC